MPGGSEAGARTDRWSAGPLVGRDELMLELVAAADAAVLGAGSIVVLTAGTGFGKFRRAAETPFNRIFEARR